MCMFYAAAVAITCYPLGAMVPKNPTQSVSLRNVESSPIASVVQASIEPEPSPDSTHHVIGGLRRHKAQQKSLPPRGGHRHHLNPWASATDVVSLEAPSS